MALYDGFFDAVYNETEETFDRTYDSSAFVDYFYQFIGDGVCVYNNPDSFRVYIQNGAIVVKPGYLFLQGYWLKNTADYTLSASGTDRYAVVAHLNRAKRAFEILIQSAEQDHSDSLVLAFVNIQTNRTEDTRYNTDICGVIDSAGNLSEKVQFALNYIDTQVEAKLREVEIALQAKSQELDNQISKVKSMAEAITPPPIGAIKFAVNPPGNEWLRCDGSYISKNDYPELVSILGNVSTNGSLLEDNYDKGLLSGDISNGVFCRDCYIVYSHAQRRLFVTYNPVINLPKPENNDFNSNSPIYASEVDGDVFLVQKNGSNFTIWMIQKPTVEHFNPTVTTYSTDDYFASLNTVMYIYRRNTARAIPYVIKQGGYYYMMIGTTYRTDGTITRNYYLCLKFSSLQNVTYEVFDRHETDGLYSSNATIPQGYLGFSKRNKSECIYLSKFDSMTTGITIKSLLNNLIAFNAAYSKTASGGAPSFPISCLPIVGGDQIFYGMKIYSDYIAVESLRNGGMYNRIRVPLKLPYNATVFYDAAVYIEAQQMWVFFVGTGFVFAKNLDVPSDFGYIDLTDKSSTVTKNGHLEFEHQTGSLARLWVSGTTANGNSKIVSYAVSDNFFNYSTTGAWLPTVYLDENSIPGYIKAVTT